MLVAVVYVVYLFNIRKVRKNIEFFSWYLSLLLIQNILNKNNYPYSISCHNEYHGNSESLFIYWKLCLFVAILQHFFLYLYTYNVETSVLYAYQVYRKIIKTNNISKSIFCTMNYVLLWIWCRTTISIPIYTC